MGIKNTKIGDIFEVKVTENSRKFFQFIANDVTQLNSNVIRAFKKEYSSEVYPELSEVINDNVDFYAHCIIKLGLKMALWDKIGNFSDIGNLDDVLFRRTSDYGTKVGVEPVRVSFNWDIWKINDPGFTKIGKLEGKNRDAEIGIVVNPYDIKERIVTGKYNFSYPDYI